MTHTQAPYVVVESPGFLFTGVFWMTHTHTQENDVLLGANDRDRLNFGCQELRASRVPTPPPFLSVGRGTGTTTRLSVRIFFFFSLAMIVLRFLHGRYRVVWWALNNGQTLTKIG